MLGTLFLGDDETTNETAPSEPSVEVKRFDPVKLSSLAKLLGVKGKASGEPLDVTAEEHWVLPISTKLVAALAKLDDKKRPAIAKEWAATEEWKLDKGTVAGLSTLLADLKQLAARSVADDKPMFLWMSL